MTPKDAQKLHEFEQAFAFLVDNLAPSLFRYYNNLLAAGFNEERAFVLTVSMQQSLLLRGVDTPDKGDGG